MDMFWKKKEKKKVEEKHEYDVRYENVAVPEVHIHKEERNASLGKDINADADADSGEKETVIAYDSLAVPEIHIKKKR